MAPINVGHIPSPDPSDVTDQQIEETVSSIATQVRELGKVAVEAYRKRYREHGYDPMSLEQYDIIIDIIHYLDTEWEVDLDDLVRAIKLHVPAERDGLATADPLDDAR